MAKKRISKSIRKKIKVKEAVKKNMTEYGAFIDGQHYEISDGDDDFEFMKGLWEAIEQDVKDSAKLNQDS